MTTTVKRDARWDTEYAQINSMMWGLSLEQLRRVRAMMEASAASEDAENFYHTMTKEEMQAEISESLAQIERGEVYPFDEVMQEIATEFGLSR
ncbi:MAG: hypothetical protein IK127_06010 [Clostridia bacterium]|nr:hypothetical protein [Clostridia bacterium]